MRSDSSSQYEEIDHLLHIHPEERQVIESIIFFFGRASTFCLLLLYLETRCDGKILVLIDNAVREISSFLELDGFNLSKKFHFLHSAHFDNQFSIGIKSFRINGFTNKEKNRLFKKVKEHGEIDEGVIKKIKERAATVPLKNPILLRYKIHRLSLNMDAFNINQSNFEKSFDELKKTEKWPICHNNFDENTLKALCIDIFPILDYCSLKK